MPLKIGDPAPDFTLPDENGKPVTLSSFRGRKVILYFYPKDDTPGCTAQACGFRDAYPKVEAANAVVLGISPDGAKSHQKFKTKQKLPFPLLSDEDHAVAEKYGVWGEKSFIGKKYMGITRSHFVIDEAGKLADVQIKVSPNDSVKLALERLKA
ncbi:MAG: thioredoxin-dependent thiol peroxidase [Anaerolineales bacterium]|nr:thioredoxin-dependent thiol peroxidase [Anaerolineales bacterium]